MSKKKPTKYQILSDLHLEHYNRRPGGAGGFIDSLPAAAPNLILAGDIGSLVPGNNQWMLRRIKDFLEKWERVYYIPGNHEFYGTSIAEGLRVLENLAFLVGPKFRVLGGVRAERQGGLKIWGNTMWFPEPTPEQFTLKLALGYPVNDFNYINNFVKTYAREHAAFVKRLTKIKPDVVVTHHLPSYKSVNGRYVNDRSNWCYVAPAMEAYILEHQPKLWIHGHTHDPCDYMIGQTRVIGNPSGYPHDYNPAFRPDLVVEL